MTDIEDPPAHHPVQTRIRVGIGWAVGGQVVLQVVRFIGTAVLARLLAPSDYGAAAIAVTFASYASIVGDFGFGRALIQARNDTQSLRSTAFWAASTGGLLLAVVAVLVADPVSSVLDQAGTAPLTAAGGATFLLFALSSTSSALLAKAMNFRAIETTTVVAWIIATAFGIGCAVAGFGAWALVGQQLALFTSGTVMLVIRARWVPSLTASLADVRRLGPFASLTTVGAFLSLGETILVNLVVGQTLGVRNLGLWVFAMSTIAVPIALFTVPVARVLFAGFSGIQGQTESIARLWLSSVRLLGGVVLPALAGLAAVAPDFVTLVFGDQWLPAAALVQIFCFLAAFRALLAANASVTDAAGRPEIALYLLLSVILTAVPAVWFGSRGGVEAAAAAYVFTVVLFGDLPSLAIVLRQLELGAKPVIRALVPVCLVAIGTGFVAAAVRAILVDSGTPALFRLVAAIGVGTVAYVVLLRLVVPEVFTTYLRQARAVGGRPTAAATRP